MKLKRMAALLLALLLLAASPLGALSGAKAESAPLNLSVTFSPASVNVGSTTQVTWKVTGGLSPEIAYANWRIYDVNDTAIGTVPASNITSLSGTVSFKPSYGAKARLYLQIRQGDSTEGLTSTAVLTITDSTPLDGTISFDKSSVDVGGSITANWNITGGNAPKIISSEWVLYDRQGGAVKTYQAGIAQSAFSGSTQFTTPSDSAVREKAASGLLRIRVTDASGRDHTFEPASRFTINHWENEGGKYYYYRNGSKIFGGPHLIGGQYYYFLPATREMATGWISAGPTTSYYAADSGALYVAKWLQEGTDYYYFKSPMGVMARDETILIGGKQNSFDANGKWMGETEPFNGWFDQGGKRYFNKNGTKVTGWLKDAGRDYYLSPEDASMQTGWLLYKGQYYYLRTAGGAGVKGSMVTGGNFLIDGKLNSFTAAGVWTGTVSIDTGWVQGDSGWYYYRSGVAQKGWVSVGGAWYYMNNDGLMLTGWRLVSGYWYYFSPDGAMKTGWITLSGKQYYLLGDGSMATGRLVIGSKAYTFDGSGALIKEEDITPHADGWALEGSTWYYYKGGVRATGWLLDGGKWYYLRSNGAMATGWVKDGGSWYLLRSNGAMATGWAKDGSAWYYLRSSGAMATGWLQLGSNWFYLKGDGSMATGTYTISGTRHVFDANGFWLGTK